MKRTKRGFRRKGKRTNKKRVNKKVKKIMGGNPDFTVMTFNVECWLNQIKLDNKDAFTIFMTSESKESEVGNWQQMKAIFNDVDIACIQENAVIKQQDGSFKNYIANIGDLKLISSCQSHDFHWPQTQGLYGVGSKISNSIYSRYGSSLDSPLVSQLSEDGETTIDTFLELTKQKEKHPRCWAISEIPIQDKTVKVASIHLSGGRFDDIASLEGENFMVKKNQIKELLKENPDIVCGDLNTKLVPPEEDKYFLGLPFNGTKVSDNLPNESLTTNWKTWMYGLDSVFKESGYKSVFEGSVAPDTSIFGGTVDMIYYKPDILTCSNSSAVSGAMELNKRILSDHAPVKASFSFVSK
jgi:endonuclease/exonuclease/phosphatase family metal-dependent hydrolase